MSGKLGKIGKYILELTLFPRKEGTAPPLPCYSGNTNSQLYSFIQGIFSFLSTPNKLMTCVGFGRDQATQISIQKFRKKIITPGDGKRQKPGSAMAEKSLEFFVVKMTLATFRNLNPRDKSWN